MFNLKLVFLTARTTVLVVALGGMFFTSCNRNKDLSEEEIYGILNEIIRDDSLMFHSVCWQYDSLTITADAMKNFSEEDIRFYQRQRSLLMKNDIKPNKLRCYSWRLKDYRYMELDSNTEDAYFTRLSFPLITPDRQRVFIEICENCNMMLGGSGYQVLYEKKNGKWIVHSSYNYWISYARRKQEILLAKR